MSSNYVTIEEADDQKAKSSEEIEKQKKKRISSTLKMGFFMFTILLLSVIPACILGIVSHDEIFYKHPIVHLAFSFLFYFICYWFFKGRSSITQKEILRQGITRANLKESFKYYLLAIGIIPIVFLIHYTIFNEYGLGYELNLFYPFDIDSFHSYNILDWIFFIIRYCLLIPIAEGILFRGFMMQSISKDIGSERFALIISAVFIGLLRSYVISFFSCFVLGVLLGYIVYRTGSLKTSILTHTLYNATYIAQLLFANKNFEVPLFIYFILVIPSIIVFICSYKNKSIIEHTPKGTWKLLWKTPLTYVFLITFPLFLLFAHAIALLALLFYSFSV